MPRLTVSLTAEQRDWIEREGDREDCSKSQVVRGLIDDARVADSETERRLDALERRMTELERRGGEPSGEHRAGGEERGEREVWEVVRDAIGDGWVPEEIVVAELDDAVDWREREFASAAEVLETMEEQARVARRDGEVQWLGL